MWLPNYGVPGDSLDQSYLRYTARRPAADTVLIGFISENLDRTINRFRPF